MKKICLLSLLALAACGPSNNQNQQQAWNDGNSSVQVCMNKTTGQRIPDDQCQQASYNNGGISPFVWFYLGSQMAVPAYYSAIPSYYGSYAPMRGYHYYHDYHPHGVTVIERRTYVYPRPSGTAPAYQSQRPYANAYRSTVTPIQTSRLSQGSAAGTPALRPAITGGSAYSMHTTAPASSAYRPSVSSSSSYSSSSRSSSYSSGSRRH